MKLVLIFTLVLVCASCSGHNDNEHTTATTIVPPPPQQVLRAELRPGLQVKTSESKPSLLLLNIPQTTIREGEELVVNFVLGNAKLKGDGGEYRIRYMIDDGDMQWLDRWEQLALSGWIPGKHMLRVELIGAEGWPVAVETREITIVK